MNVTSIHFFDSHTPNADGWEDVANELSRLMSLPTNDWPFIELEECEAISRIGPFDILPCKCAGPINAVYINSSTASDCFAPFVDYRLCKSAINSKNGTATDAKSRVTIEIIDGSLDLQPLQVAGAHRFLQECGL